MTETPDSRAAFRAAIEGALALLEAPAPDAQAEQTLPEPTGTALPSLLDQCLEMVAGTAARAEPIRVLHHMACTGGTLISRCVAALPNTRLLSEVDPLSPMDPPDRFLPADVLGLARTGSRPPEPEVLQDIFLAGLDVLYRDSLNSGLRLVLRDHAHGLYGFGDRLPERAGLREVLGQAGYRLRGMVTVRHPLDSYLSLLDNGWDHYSPAGIEEYCRRYLIFLDRHDDQELLRYEDFVADPDAAMQRIGTTLDLPFDPGYADTFGAITLSGDSGRRGAKISPRPRRPVPDTLAAELGKSESYARLCKRLGYPADTA